MDPQFFGFSIIIASFLPVLVRFVKQAHYMPVTNGAIAVAVYIAFGVAAVLVSGTAVTFANLTIVAGIFTVVGTAAYAAFWKNLEGPAPAPATSLGPIEQVGTSV